VSAGISLQSGKCDYLRSKSAFGIYGDDGSVHLQEAMGATTRNWCLLIMGKAGPDEHYVHGSLCREGRSCFQAREADGE
jgi:hypothetical protein